MDKPSHQLAIISMEKERQAQIQQAIHLLITAKPVTIVIFWTVNESKRWDYTGLEFLFALIEIHEYKFV